MPQVIRGQCNSVSRLVAILGTRIKPLPVPRRRGPVRGSIIPVISLVVEVGGRSVMQVAVMSCNAENSGAVSDSVGRTVHHTRRILPDVL